MNCLRGFPVPKTVKGSPDATAQRRHSYDKYTNSVHLVSTFSEIALVNESWDHVAVFQVEVVMGTEYVCWDNAGKHATILLMVCPEGGGCIVLYSHKGVITNTVGAS